MKRKKLLSFILAAALSFMSLATVLAAPDTTDDSDEVSTSESSVSESTGTSTSSGSDEIYIEDPTLTAPDVSHSQAALLLDFASGRLIYGKNIDQQVYPASTTKIMTAILALEMCPDLSQTVTANYQALASITLEDSHMGILIGEELTLEQLITGMLVYSANDAANVLAIHIAGSLDAFADLMNQKAQELGMTGTHFVNPCGSHDDNHYTTARDLATLAQYAMQNDKFREIVKMPIYKIAPTNKYTQERILVNTNLFLGTSRSTYYYYPPCTGIKTGHTSQAGYCLVASAAYNDTNLLAIVMNCQNLDTKENAYSYIDSKNLFEFGFDNYVQQTIASPGDIVSDSKVYEAKKDARVALTVENELAALIPISDDDNSNIVTNVQIPDELQAPIEKGTVIGTVTYTYGDTQIGSANLVAANDVERNNLLHVLHIVIKVVTSPFFFIPAILIIIIAIIARHQKKKKERKKRIQQLKRNRQKNGGDVYQRVPDRNATRTERQSLESKGSTSRYRSSDRDDLL
jgi:D-alanyl-D-alanine carboxypeptidase (penicillin-binding protein 5/6)